MIIVIVDDDAVDELGSSDEVRELLEDLVDQGVVVAQSLAPRATGAGAESIDGEVVYDADGTLVGRFSWDAEHGYMVFAEEGTAREPAQPFIRPAGDALHL